MKNLLCLLFLLSSAVAAAAQDRAGVDATPSALVAAEPVWAVVAVNAAPGNPYSGGGGRGVYRDDPSRPRHVSAAVAQARPRASGGGRISMPPWRAASVGLTNAGAREVRSVRLEFVFTDAPGGTEVLRLGLHARKRLRAGETVVVKKTVKGTPTNRRGDGAGLTVEIKEVVYADGAVWRPGAGN